MAAVDYFARRGPTALVFGSFAFVMVPLLLLRAVPNFWSATSTLAFFEATVLGTAHFFITLALYLQSGNLDYFARDGRNRVLFFAIPALILIGVALLNSLPYGKNAFALYFFFAVRFADFLHVGRQSFGMMQLFKRARCGVLPPSLRRAENVFFVGMAALQWVTFAYGGRFPADVLWLRALVAVAVVLALCIAGTYAFRASRPVQGERQSFIPLGYFSMQAFAAALSVYRTELYAVALTVHYAEYHVIMAPRLFQTPLEPARRLDRVFGWLRNHVLLLYGLLLVVVLSFELRERVAVGSAVPLRVLLHLFDGIFLLHYFVDAFLWKFRDPVLGPRLGELYFAPTRAAREVEDAGAAPRVLGHTHGAGVAAAPTSPRKPWYGVRPALAACAGGLIMLAAWQPLGLVARIHARQHRRWGIDYARSGELTQARRHLSEALQYAPDDSEAQRALKWVEGRLAVER